MLVADQDGRVLGEDGELLSHIAIDPRRDYQPKTRAWCPGYLATVVLFRDISRRLSNVSPGAALVTRHCRLCC
jgi:hypothetical protein